MKLPLAIISLAAFAVAQTGIAGSAHDFSGASWNNQAGHKPGEVCGVCHIPHVEGRPASRTTHATLWAREDSAVTSYTMYFGYGINGTFDPQPSGSSGLCLGCHDGSVALEMFGSFTGTGTNFIDVSEQVPGLNGGTDFSSDHPISITYADDPLGEYDENLRPRTSGYAGKTIADFLEGGKVQCKTCHDVHNVDTAPGAASLLVIKNDDPLNPSALCRACHIK